MTQRHLTKKFLEDSQHTLCRMISFFHTLQLEKLWLLQQD